MGEGGDGRFFARNGWFPSQNSLVRSTEKYHSQNLASFSVQNFDCYTFEAH